jgi:hypothetical protein
MVGGSRSTTTLTLMWTLPVPSRHVFHAVDARIRRARHLGQWGWRMPASVVEQYPTATKGSLTGRTTLRWRPLGWGSGFRRALPVTLPLQRE